MNIEKEVKYYIKFCSDEGLSVNRESLKEYREYLYDETKLDDDEIEDIYDALLDVIREEERIAREREKRDSGRRRVSTRTPRRRDDVSSIRGSASSGLLGNRGSSRRKDKEYEKDEKPKNRVKFSLKTPETNLNKDTIVIENILDIFNIPNRTVMEVFLKVPGDASRIKGNELLTFISSNTIITDLATIVGSTHYSSMKDKYEELMTDVKDFIYKPMVVINGTNSNIADEYLSNVEYFKSYPLPTGYNGAIETVLKEEVTVSHLLIGDVLYKILYVDGKVGFASALNRNLLFS